MKFLLIISLLISPAFASEFWKIETQKKFLVTSKEEITKVVELYPRIINFPGISVSKIIKIDLTDITYKYIGEHTCVPDDSRLKTNFVTWEICLKDGSCAVPSIARPLRPYDPCK